MSFPRGPEQRHRGVDWFGRGAGDALNSSVVRDGMLGILLEHAKLYEQLRQRVKQ